jgi:hypothetical protein
MVILGIVLAAAAVGVGAGVVMENSASASLSVFGQSVPGVHTDAQVFIVGGIVAIFAYSGFMMALFSVLRSMRARRELRDLRDEREESMATLEKRNQQLQRELVRARSDVGPAGPAGAAMDAGGAPVTQEVPVWPRKGAGAREPESPFFDRSA